MAEIPQIPPTTKDEQLIGAINDRLRRINEALGAEAGTAAASATLNYGTHATRLARPVKGFVAASAWFETDRTVSYQMESNVWKYRSGIMVAAFASRATDLGANDVGLLWSVSDYAHLLRWTGTGWEFVDEMGGYVAGRMVAPDGNGWQLCDGSATHYLHVSGGVVSEVAHTTLVLTGGAYLKFAAAYGGAITAATAPGAVLTGTAATAAGNTYIRTIDTTGQPAHVDLLPYFRR